MRSVKNGILQLCLLLLMLRSGLLIRPPRRQSLVKTGQTHTEGISPRDLDPLTGDSFHTAINNEHNMDTPLHTSVAADATAPATSSAPITSRRELLRLRSRQRSEAARTSQSSSARPSERTRESSVASSFSKDAVSSHRTATAGSNTRRRPADRRRRPTASFSDLVKKRPAVQPGTAPASQAERTSIINAAESAGFARQPLRRGQTETNNVVNQRGTSPGQSEVETFNSRTRNRQGENQQRQRPSAFPASISAGDNFLQTGSASQQSNEAETSATIPDYDTECPERNGFFADAFQCDRYYECSNNELTEKLCPDGLVFNDFSSLYERCDFMHGVNCSGREELQPARPSGRCPRQNGYYPHHDPAVCDQFVQCVAGQVNPLTCPAGLVFSSATGTCQWPDQAGRTGCSSKDVLQFTCPHTKPIDVRTLAPGQPLHPRFPDNTDCRFFFTCIEGVIPRRHGCQQGQVFNDVSKACDELKNVPECVAEDQVDDTV